MDPLLSMTVLRVRSKVTKVIQGNVPQDKVFVNSNDDKLLLLILLSLRIVWKVLVRQRRNTRTLLNVVSAF